MVIAKEIKDVKLKLFKGPIPLSSTKKLKNALQLEDS